MPRILGAMSPRRPDMPSLDRDDLMGDPIAQFSAWWSDAEEVPLRDAMTLATVDADGRPGRADGPAQGLRHDRLSLLHQLRVGEGGAARRGRPRGADPLLARARPAGAGPRRRSSGWTPQASDEYFASGRATPSSAPGPRPRASRSPTGPSSTRRLAEVEERFDDVRRWSGPDIGAAMSSVTSVVEFWQGQVGSPPRPLPPTGSTATAGTSSGSVLKK